MPRPDGESVWGRDRRIRFRQGRPPHRTRREKMTRALLASHAAPHRADPRPHGRTSRVPQTRCRQRPACATRRPIRHCRWAETFPRRRSCLRFPAESANSARRSPLESCRRGRERAPTSLGYSRPCRPRPRASSSRQGMRRERPLPPTPGRAKELLGTHRQSQRQGRAGPKWAHEACAFLGHPSSQAGPSCQEARSSSPQPVQPL